MRPGSLPAAAGALVCCWAGDAVIAPPEHGALALTPQFPGPGGTGGVMLCSPQPPRGARAPWLPLLSPGPSLPSAPASLKV